MSKPEKVFKMGAVRASVFVNEIVREGKPVELRKVVIEVRYRDFLSALITRSRAVGFARLKAPGACGGPRRC